MLHDIRFAIRLLVKDRWFTVAATMALALGIGMNATVFTLVNSFLFRSLPFEDPDRVMYVGERDTLTGRNFMMSWPDFQDWRDSQKTFVGLGAWSASTMNVSDEGRPPERYIAKSPVAQPLTPRRSLGCPDLVGGQGRPAAVDQSTVDDFPAAGCGVFGATYR